MIFLENIPWVVNMESFLVFDVKRLKTSSTV